MPKHETRNVGRKDSLFMTFVLQTSSQVHIYI